MHLICSFLALTALSTLASAQITIGPTVLSINNEVGSAASQPLTLPYSTVPNGITSLPTSFPTPLIGTTFPPVVSAQPVSSNPSVISPTGSGIGQSTVAAFSGTPAVNVPSPTGGLSQPTIVGTNPLSQVAVSATNPLSQAAGSTPLPNTFGQSTTRFLGTVIVTRNVSEPGAGQVGQSTTPLIEAAAHVQIVFNNLFSKTVPPGTNTAVYQVLFAEGLGRVCGVRSDRVTNIVSVAHPVTDAFVLRFTIQPISSARNCTSSAPCGVTVKEALGYLERAINNDAGLQLPGVIEKQVLNVTYQSNTTLVTWTDYGPCPTKVCTGSTPVCNYTVNATYYCTQVAQNGSSQQLLYLLFLLLLIPIIIIIIAVACVISDRRKKKAADEKNKSKRMVRSDMLSYHEYTIREKELQPKISATIASRSTINADTMNTLYRSLGANLSIAYNGATFITEGGGSGTEPADNSEMDSSSGVAILPINDD